MRPGTPLPLENARRLEGYVDHYTDVRLNSASGTWRVAVGCRYVWQKSHQ